MLIIKPFKYILPFGLVTLYNRKKKLERLGIQKSWKHFRSFGKILKSLNMCGMDLLPPGEIQNLNYVADLGANNGLWSRHFINCHLPEKLISFEPVPEICRELRDQLLPYPFAEAKCMAMGADTGNILIHVTEDTTGASALKPTDEMQALVDENWNIQKNISCPMDTIDNQLAGWPEISLLKIDVQGFELEVLKGAVQSRIKTKYILVEMNYFAQYEGGSVYSDLHNYLQSEWGFHLRSISSPLIIKNRAIYSDALYVNPNFIPEREYNSSGAKRYFTKSENASELQTVPHESDRWSQ